MSEAREINSTLKKFCTVQIVSMTLWKWGFFAIFLKQWWAEHHPQATKVPKGSMHLGLHAYQGITDSENWNYSRTCIMRPCVNYYLLLLFIFTNVAWLRKITVWRQAILFRFCTNDERAGLSFRSLQPRNSCFA